MFRRIRWFIATILLVTVTVLGARWWLENGARSPQVFDLLALEGLERVAESYPAPDDAPFSWPRDHGVHADQFVESWLFAGMLEAQDGGRYGFQLGFYRLAMQPGSPERDSAWAVRDVYRARLSVEPDGEPARFAERLGRTALGLAGATRSPAKAWLEDWSFTAEEDGAGFVLRAADAGFGLELRVTLPEAMPVQIDNPLHRGYWWPGLAAEGWLQIDGLRQGVSGGAMLDRLWGRALPIGRGQLALTRLWLEDGGGMAIRCEHLQRRGGGGTPLVRCVGHPRVLRDYALRPADDGWQTVAGTRYPLRWEARWSSYEQSFLVAPLSPRRPAAFDARWVGVVAVAAREQAWGVLELSNFDAP